MKLDFFSWSAQSSYIRKSAFIDHHSLFVSSMPYLSRRSRGEAGVDENRSIYENSSYVDSPGYDRIHLEELAHYERVQMKNDRSPRMKGESFEKFI